MAVIVHTQHVALLPIPHCFEALAKIDGSVLDVGVGVGARGEGVDVDGWYGLAVVVAQNTGRELVFGAACEREACPCRPDMACRCARIGMSRCRCSGYRPAGMQSLSAL